jgi:hypothetical protein|tara:strand:- start:343 stop:489 length:147 start_codon:yes stop_codon:yes gene_type:complete
MDLRQIFKKAKGNGLIHHYQVQTENCQKVSGIFQEALQNAYGSDGKYP